ncbi:MAG: restriction endonuclease subunit S, partial [Bacteroidia bacterium]|nr:restriction endonuclease subunit S [Bacteroidia bacterium]
QKDFFDSTFPYIEISEIDIISGEIQNIVQVEKEKAASRAKMIVRENDIIISTTRPNRGAISLIRKDQDFSIASTGFSVIRNITNPEIDREYLFTILRQQIILKQFEQRSSGGNYPAITQEELGSVTIPLPKREIQKEIVKVFNGCFTQKQKNEAEAEKLLSSIDDYLLNELGIKLPEPPENTLKNRMFTVSIAELSGNRYDPNYHQKYFQNVFSAFEKGKYEYSQIRKYASFQAGYAFKSSDYLEQSNCLLITIKNIRQNKIDIEDATYLPDDFFEQYKEFQIGNNDLLIAMTGATIGKVGIYNHPNNSLLNQRNGIIKPDNINSIYLMSLLNLTIFQKLILRNSNGGAQPNISETDIMRISIPVPPIEKQKEIAEHITGIRQQAQQLKDKTSELLKKAIEEIEEILLA